MIQSHKVDLEEVQVEVGPSDIRPTSDPISRKFMQQNQDKIVTSYIYYVISEVDFIIDLDNLLTLHAPNPGPRQFLWIPRYFYLKMTFLCN